VASPDDQQPCGFIAARTGPGFPPVVTGDLNAEPDADEVRLTWDRRNPYVAATGEPSARIDYVLVGLPTAGGAGRVRSAPLIGDQPVRGVWPSDHAGVLAELQPPSDDRPDHH
jgi:endonuclease/exonuclease/phosphatase family metal-dependent hydrolase